MHGSAVNASTIPIGRAVRVALWIAQILLAVSYGAAGFMKSTYPFHEKHLSNE
jgi:hypothetical protein